MTEQDLGMLGKYRVLEEIGRGGFSVVYRAEHPKLKKTVAIKLMLPALFSDPQAIQRFITEARTVAALKQENITHVLDLAEQEGRLYMVMEYMPGGDLHAWLAQHGTLSFRRALEVVAAIAAALDYAHSQGIIHGDVKPGNILISAEGTAKLTDFGVLRAVESSGVTSADMTRGTPYYISPEQAEGGQSTALSDQYALGVVAYELLTGQLPFEGDTPLAIYLKHLRESPPPASQANPLITPALEAALHKALEKDPAARYPDCRTFARALREAVAATETEQFQDLMKRAGEALAAHQPEAARPLIDQALQSQPEDAQARALLDELQARERAQRGYQGASEAVFTAKNAARLLREQPAPPPDPDGLLARLAPPPPPAWKRMLLRWQLGLFVALGLLLLGAFAGLGDVAYTGQPQGTQRKATLVAGVRTSTPTFTPTSTFTPTFTPTNTPTSTSTSTLTPIPTPTAPGGGAGKVLYHFAGDIYLVNADGSDPVNLTNNKAHDDFRAWSPDGKKIVFSSDRDGNYEIYSMNADGSKPVNLTNNKAHDDFRAWSPDGKKIVFSSDRGGNYEIYSMNADGSDPVNLTNDKAYNRFCAWSPNGKKIVFSSDRDGNREIYSMNADGSKQVNLTNNTADDWFYAWSFDGEKIFFGTNRDGNSEIYVMNADGSNPVNLTKSRAHDYFSAWSLDGQKIVFESNRDGNSRDIYIMNVDGSNPVNLTNSMGHDYFLTWSLDGKKIVFTSHRDANEEIYIMNADGSSLVNLTNDGKDDSFYALSPDSKKIMFRSSRGGVGIYDTYIVNLDGTDIYKLAKEAYSAVWVP